jgi:hypothetical protein
MTADSCAGLASHNIELGDQLCTINGNDDMHLVIRSRRDSGNGMPSDRG